MTVRACANCGVPEQRGQDAKGRPTVNLSPLTNLCIECTVADASGSHTFHSRREERQGEVIDTKQLQAGKDAD